MSKKDGGPAFPGVTWITQGDNKNPEGMTLRDYFAAKAMTGMLSGYEADQFKNPQLAQWSYQIADEMLKAREE